MKGERKREVEMMRSNVARFPPKPDQAAGGEGEGAGLVGRSDRFAYMQKHNPEVAAMKLRRMSRLRPRLAIVLGSGFHHVLSEFDPAEKATIDRAIERAAEAIEHVARNGIASAMNNYNKAE